MFSFWRHYFNPRSYKRSDIGVFPAQDPVYLFQSTLLQEERRCYLLHSWQLGIFQSTLLQEERPLQSQNHYFLKYFNPRSYKRSDSNLLENIAKFLISIHAPTRGATDGSFSDAYPTLISIHAPTRGATIGSEPGFPNLLISIHAPTRGATIKRFPQNG